MALYATNSLIMVNIVNNFDKYTAKLEKMPISFCHSIQMIRTDNIAGVPLIRLSSINPFLQELVARGLDARSMLEELGLPGQLPASSELFVAAPSIYEIVEESARVANDRYFAARLGASLDLLNWEPIADAANMATNIGELLNRFIVSLKQHASSIQYSVETVGDRATFRTQRVLVPDFPPAQNDAFYLGFMSKLMRSAVGDHWQPEKVLATMCDPSVAPPEFSDIRLLRGDHRGFSLAFPAEWLFARFEKNSFAARAKQTTDSYAPLSLIESVRIAIEPHIHEDNLTVGKAAEICGLEKRHLSRRLKGKGTTLSREIARLREARASKALAKTNERIADIGMNVGFNDPTVFSRAFKNWTGKSPQAFRRFHRLRDTGRKNEL
jgi:AraC-like DNA-binding protein